MQEYKIQWKTAQKEMAFKSPLNCTVVHSGECIEQCVVALHGYGDTALSFSQVSDNIPLKNTLWIFVEAPFSLPNRALNGKQWHEIFGAPFWEVEEAKTKIMTLLVRVMESFSLKSEQILLFGFSQGGFMALYTALRLPFKVGGIISLNGFIAMTHRLAQQEFEEKKNLPIFLGHGLHDEFIYPFWHYSTLDLLEHHHFTKVTSRVYQSGHDINPDTFKDIKVFIEGLH